MKRVFLVGIMVFCVVAIFAAPPMMGFGNGTQTASELIELTGAVSLGFNQPPMLEVGSKKYYLMIQHNIDIDANIKAGDKITVKGYVLENTTTTTELVLHVTVLKAGGKEYVLPKPGFMMGNGMFGQGSGMMGKGYKGNYQGGIQE